MEEGPRAPPHGGGGGVTGTASRGRGQGGPRLPRSSAPSCHVTGGSLTDFFFFATPSSSSWWKFELLGKKVERRFLREAVPADGLWGRGVEG